MSKHATTDVASAFPTYDDIVNNKPDPIDPSKNRNQDYVDAMKKRFGNNNATDNYSKRMKSGGK